MPQNPFLRLSTIMLLLFVAGLPLIPVAEKLLEVFGTAHESVFAGVKTVGGGLLGVAVVSLVIAVIQGSGTRR